jgi:GTPase SAR1 family protein
MREFKVVVLGSGGVGKLASYLLIDVPSLNENDFFFGFKENRP